MNKYSRKLTLLYVDMPVTTISSFRKCAFIHSEYLRNWGENRKINNKKNE